MYAHTFKGSLNFEKYFFSDNLTLNNTVIGDRWFKRFKKENDVRFLRKG